MFESASKKIDRAQKHISDLDASYQAFADTNVYVPFAEGNPNKGASVLDIKFANPLPDDIGLIIGDVVHNLRSALDHLMWELIGIDGGTQNRHLQFIFRADRTDFEAACNGIITPRADTKAFMLGFETYAEGKGRNLYGLHLLNNTDKHAIITPLVAGGTITKLRVINANGSVVTTMTNCGATVGPNGETKFLLVGPGMSIEFDDDSKVIPGIFFQDVDIFPFQPIIPTLVQLANDVRDVREAFVSFVQTRL